MNGNNIVLKLIHVAAFSGYRHLNAVWHTDRSLKYLRQPTLFEYFVLAGSSYLDLRKPNKKNRLRIEVWEPRKSLYIIFHQRSFKTLNFILNFPNWTTLDSIQICF